MDLDRGFVQLVVVIIIAATVVGGGFLYYRNQKIIPKTHTQEFSEPEAKTEEKEEKKGVVPREAVKSEAKPAVLPAPPKKEGTYSNTAQQTSESRVPDLVRWDYNRDGVGWRALGKPPECPPLEFASPADVRLATSILYPGQTRGQSVNAGDNYKPHGGFRFDNRQTNDIAVRAPFSGYALQGARNFVEGGEVQYSFDIVHPCGIMFRLGHLLELSPTFKMLADTLPEPKLLDSRTYNIEPTYVAQGDLIATKVGIAGNVFFDWGVYDLRKENNASQDSQYREKYWNLRWFTFHALCWLDYLSSIERAAVNNLPSADIAGKTSDYCRS